MSLSALAWGPGHPSIVTFDDAELLAYDSETEGPKWRLPLGKAIAGVALGDASALDVAGDAGAPFRSPAGINALLAVDVEGTLHAVDASTGKPLGSVGPFGAPRSLATAVVGGGIAIAAAGKVVVWRKGARSELMLEATAVAWSNDGATVAIATEQGVVKMFDVTGLDGQDNLREVVAFDAKGPVADLAQHPSGAWVIAGSRATLRIDGPGSEKTLEKIPVGAKRIRFDASGNRVAVQLSQRQVLVYEWPALSVLTRIEYTERPVRGIAFGKGNWLGVAMDYGDGNKIDVITNAVHRTDTHPGRQHRSWSLYVEGGKKEAARPATGGGGGLSAADEDAIRRMRDPAPVDSGGFGRGGRIGIISMISLCLLGFRVCLRAGGSGSSYSSSSYSSSGYTPPASTTCGQSCAADRIARLVKDCASADCSRDAYEAANAIAEGDCAKTKAALARIPKDSTAAPLLGVDKLLAEMGVNEACESGAVTPKAKKKIVHPRLVRLVGPSLTESSEDIPELESTETEGEKPRAAWTASDGTLYVVGVTGGATRVVVHQRSASGAWKVVYQEPVLGDEPRVDVFGRSANDVYVSFGRALVHYDGKEWGGTKSPPDPIAALAGTTTDLYADSSDALATKVYRRRGTEWIKERTPEGMIFAQLRAGGSAVWAFGDSAGKSVVAQRGADGTWAIKTPGAEAGAPSPTAIWVSPTGDPFVLTDQSVLRGSAGGSKWVEDDLLVAGALKAIWGRSSNDVYASSFSRLLHFDGKTWSTTSYQGKAAVLSGTAKEVFVIRADE